MLVATYLKHAFGRRWITAVILATAALFLTPGSASAARAPVSLGDSARFGVLAGNAVVNSNMTSVTGDLGVSPGNSVVGFPPGTVSSTIHAGDAVAANAKADIVAVYNDIAGRPPVAEMRGAATWSAA